MSSARPSASSCSRIRPILRSSSLAASRYAAQSGAGDRMVGIVGRDVDLGRVGVRRGVERPVGLLEIDLGEERLVRLQVGPAVASRTASPSDVKFQSVLPVPAKPTAAWEGAGRWP